METYSSINAYGYHSPYQYDPHSLHWCFHCPSTTKWVSTIPLPPHPFQQPFYSTPPPPPNPTFAPVAQIEMISNSINKIQDILTEMKERNSRLDSSLLQIQSLLHELQLESMALEDAKIAEATVEDATDNICINESALDLIDANTRPMDISELATECVEDSSRNYVCNVFAEISTRNIAMEFEDSKKGDSVEIATQVFDEMPHFHSTTFASQQANHTPDILDFEHSPAAAVSSELIPDRDDNDTKEASIDSQPLVIALGVTNSKRREALSIYSNITDHEVKCDSPLLDCIREIDSTIVPFNTWMGICLQFEKSGVTSSLFDKMLDNNGASRYSLISENVTAQQMLHHFPFDPGSRAELVSESVAVVFDNTSQYLPCTTLGVMSTMAFEENPMVRITGQVFDNMSLHGCCSKVLLDEPSVTKLLTPVSHQVCLMLTAAKRFTNLDHLIGGTLKHCLHYDPYLRDLFESILGATRDILCVIRSCAKPKAQTEANPIVLLHDFDSSCLEWRYTLPLLEEAGWETWTVDMLGWGSFALDMRPFCDVAPNCDLLYSLWTTYINWPVAETFIVIGRYIGCLCCAGIHSRHDYNVLPLKCRDVAADATHCFDIEGYKVDYDTSFLSGFHSRSPLATQLAQVLDAWVQSNLCANYDSGMVYVPKGKLFSSIDPTEFFKDLEKYTELESVKQWRKFRDIISPRLAAAMSLPSLSIRGNLDVLATDAARYNPSLLQSFDPIGYQQTLGATKLRRHFLEIINSLGVTDLFIHSWILARYNFEKMSAGNLLDLIKIYDVVGKYFYELLFRSEDGHFYAGFLLAMLFPTLQLSIQRDVAAHVMPTISAATYGVYSHVEGEILKATAVHDEMVGIKPNTLICSSLIRGYYNECKLLEYGFVSGAAWILLKVRPTLRFVVNYEMPRYGEQQDTVYSGTMNPNFSNARDGIQENTSKLLLVDGVDHTDFQFLYQRILSPVTFRDNLGYNTTSMLFASSSALTYFLNSAEKRKTCRHQELEIAIIACFVEVGCMDPAPNRVTHHWVILACKFVGFSAKALHCFALLVESTFEHEKATTRGSLLRAIGEQKKIKEDDGVYCAMSDLKFTTIVVMVTKTSWSLEGDCNKDAATLDSDKFNYSNLWEQVLNNTGTSTLPERVTNVLNFIMFLMSNKCQRNQRCNGLIAGAVDVLVENVLAGLQHDSNLEDKVLFQDGRNVMNVTKLEDPFGKMANHVWDPGEIAYI